ncbi:DNA gyrase inhibitor YacG [Geoalkalibacter halelectricus]|uniref:DNA gyrase inhibitor YacG n=1 Tax=Geoalkalibacter halelectricus TaxID=2847045 RepID=A0ABY5ZMZ1_9BACT|nr:DNA gyrase inhibitor YacG [Geoalkalibacter halelectricus]MDO3380000.1 DNA gyrase inhibitor YacG [Geoalkalibacter halelectricus]UWZ80473.1 DNA gyrase inhibitor YacG [Geoalkalibacter halelectricus]
MTEKKSRKIYCPYCRSEVRWEGNPHRPFCSERCRLVDLGKWAREEYTIPGEKAPTEEPDDNN